MYNTRVFLVASAITLVSVGGAVAGECDCKDQIDNASAEVSGACSKIWSNNHCTLKEDSSSSANLRGQDFSAAQSRVIEALDSSQVFDDQEIRFISSEMFNFGYINEVRDRCRQFADLPKRQFETYVYSSLLSVKAELEIALLISSDLFSDAISFSREFDVAREICRDGSLQERQSFNIDANYFWGNGCFAGGNEREHFIINFTNSRGCPSELGF